MVKKLGIFTKISCNLEERVPIFLAPTRLDLFSVTRELPRRLGVSYRYLKDIYPGNFVSSSECGSRDMQKH